MGDKTNLDTTVNEEDFRGGGENLSQRQLVLRLIQKINDENFKRADNLIVDTGREIKILDIRETRISGIIDLNTLLQPKFDEKIKAEKKKIDESMKKNDVRFQKVFMILKAKQEVESFDLKSNSAKEDKLKKMLKWYEKIDYIVFLKNTPEYNSYLDLKSDLYQKLFDELVYLLDRVDWLSGGEEGE